MKYQIAELFDLTPGSADSILLKNTIIRATEEEIEWAHATIGDNILGMSKKS
jgi:ribonucleotide reductase beta subunit family protein with ferritin-like domain